MVGGRCVRPPTVTYRTPGARVHRATHALLSVGLGQERTRAKGSCLELLRKLLDFAGGIKFFGQGRCKRLVDSLHRRCEGRGQLRAGVSRGVSRSHLPESLGPSFLPLLFLFLPFPPGEWRMAHIRCRHLRKFICSALDLSFEPSVTDFQSHKILNTSIY